MKAQAFSFELLLMFALASALFLWKPNPAHADTADGYGWARNSPAVMDFAQYRQRVGPFATWTRANEVANYYRAMGYSTTQAFHSGDGYYFDVFIGNGDSDG
jgi:hypothetical protein